MMTESTGEPESGEKPNIAELRAFERRRRGYDLGAGSDGGDGRRGTWHPSGRNQGPKANFAV